jgi:hypothetical protein
MYLNQMLCKHVPYIFTQPRIFKNQTRTSYELEFFGGTCLKPKVGVYVKTTLVGWPQQPSILTNVGGHHFHNLTNCNITLSISNPYVVATLLHSMQGTFSP